MKCRPARYILQLQAIYKSGTVRVERYISTASTEKKAIEMGVLRMFRKHEFAQEWEAKITTVVAV